MTNGNELMNGYMVYDEDGKVVGMTRGLTKREYFAALAMQGLLAEEGPAQRESIPIFAEWAVAIADGLVKALNMEVK